MWIMQCYLSVFALFLAGKVFVSSTSCLDPTWTNVENRCYKFVDQTTNYDVAVGICADMKARLPIARTPEEVAVLEKFIALNPLIYDVSQWLGAYEYKSVYRGEDDGSSFPIPWCPGQPSGDGPCLNRGGKPWMEVSCWNDIQCAVYPWLRQTCETAVVDAQNFSRAVFRQYTAPTTSQHLATTTDHYPQSLGYSAIDSAFGMVCAATIHVPNVTQPLYQVTLAGNLVMATDKQLGALKSGGGKLIRILAYLPLEEANTDDALVKAALLWNNALQPTDSQIVCYGSVQHATLMKSGWNEKDTIYLYGTSCDSNETSCYAPAIKTSTVAPITPMSTENQEALRQWLSANGIDLGWWNDTIARSSTIIHAMGFLLQDAPDKLFYNFSSTVTWCHYNGEPCNMTYWKATKNARFGRCFTYNYQGQSSSDTGPYEEGLDVILMVNESDYVCSSESSGFVVQIHEQNETPLPDTFGHYVSPGYYKEFSMERKTEYKLDCINHPDEADIYFYNGTYSSEHCLRSCLQVNIIKQCGCAHPLYAKPADAMYCPLNESKCIDFMGQCDATLTDRTKCNCPEPCEHHKYDGPISVSTIENSILPPILKQYKEKLWKPIPSRSRNYARVRVGYITHKTMYYSEERAYKIGGLLADACNLIQFITSSGILNLVEFVVLAVCLRFGNSFY